MCASVRKREDSKSKQSNDVSSSNHTNESNDLKNILKAEKPDTDVRQQLPMHLSQLSLGYLLY